MLLNPRTLLLEAKSAVRSILGIPDPWKQFRRFEARIHPDTWRRQAELLDWAARAATQPAPKPEAAADPDLRRGLEVREQVLAKFKDSWRQAADRGRVLIHLPNFLVSPAGYSLFWNLGAGLRWLGIPVAFWEHGTPVSPQLRDFEPTILLSIDHIWYGMSRESDVSATAIEAYRHDRRLVLGLSSNRFSTDPTVLGGQLDLARTVGVDFFYSFQCPEYVERRYQPFRDRGFPVLSLEFGANPLAYYPLPDVQRDVDFVYLAATNFEKWGRCVEYLAQPLARHPGLIVGPGWPLAAAMVSEDQARALYARARIGLNLHVPFQIADPSEINERAYNLAACAVPQLTDWPALLRERLSDGAVFAAHSPAEYSDLFDFILSHPDEARRRGCRAMEEILTGHTVFHRAESLLRFVDTDPDLCEQNEQRAALSLA